MVVYRWESMIFVLVTLKMFSKVHAVLCGRGTCSETCPWPTPGTLLLPCLPLRCGDIGLLGVKVKYVSSLMAG